MVFSPPKHNERNVDDLEKSFGNGSQEQTAADTSKPSMTKCQKILVIVLVIVVFCGTIFTLKHYERKHYERETTGRDKTRMYTTTPRDDERYQDFRNSATSSCNSHRRGTVPRTGWLNEEENDYREHETDYLTLKIREYEDEI